MENLYTKHRLNHPHLCPRVQVAAVVEGAEQVGVAPAAVAEVAVVGGHLKRHSRLQVTGIDPRAG